jgi:hypothetical protein
MAFRDNSLSFFLSQAVFAAMAPLDFMTHTFNGLLCARTAEGDRATKSENKNTEAQCRSL